MRIGYPLTILFGMGTSFRTGHLGIVLREYILLESQVLENWIDEPSILDRLSSAVSAYYILLGVMSGIFGAKIGPCMHDSSYVEWPYIPYIPILLIWTLPAVYVRVKTGLVVDRMMPEQQPIQ